ncbi:MULTISPECIES: MazG nucleotide pyrophosphohydrolase domain-containing protein [Carboxydocella]|uniref:MazG nucleotide pyrophosphohydrolase domain-containing protein n=2 Tax=Carboxydocella TaxID=178898 RepID=A0A1T4MQX2_9FIRM|nr:MULTISPECIES: MazG nucleotide pyrophosphohydrolase domain-containing protein [Carboxydocella]AVX20374.1 MazG nucleotide pyrophosphohydrolase domain-containing protein [Carboxydocella thermautotrophica]AVX30798.1 MazG nucleotide pyrophosphohydrolase domain-containing protein [Carboxydocella thermautotrophica]SJZ69227.1 MazG nucleotide pyrophosphohydrolase domain-containing protein [Carboxydocella sporoproducens DSM 16521]GAW30057.1 hypothetical protein ULO1_26270 [Carboxydocella sp. ULO1]GAW
MELRAAVEAIWANRKYKVLDPRQVISHLNEEVAESLKALLRGDEESARKELEDALSCLFIALKVMDVDLEAAIERQIAQMQRSARNQSERVMVIRPGEVELLVQGVRKGGWSIWGEEDVAEAEKIAREFGFAVIYEL